MARDTTVRERSGGNPTGEISDAPGRGDIIDRRDPDYVTRSISQFDAFPTVVLRCHIIGDIISAVRFAHDNDLILSVRSSTRAPEALVFAMYRMRQGRPAREPSGASPSPRIVPPAAKPPRRGRLWRPLWLSLVLLAGGLLTVAIAIGIAGVGGSRMELSETYEDPLAGYALRHPRGWNAIIGGAPRVSDGTPTSRESWAVWERWERLYRSQSETEHRDPFRTYAVTLRSGIEAMTTDAAENHTPRFAGFEMDLQHILLPEDHAADAHGVSAPEIILHTVARLPSDETIQEIAPLHDCCLPDPVIAMRSSSAALQAYAIVFRIGNAVIVARMVAENAAALERDVRTGLAILRTITPL